MSSTKVKIYKNPERNKIAEHKPYVPQYQIMGIEPLEHKSSLVPDNNTPSPGSTDNPRAARPYIRSQPYAEVVSSPIGRGKGLIPNVGNNMEQMWSGVDGEIVDDISESLDPNHKMIDNNEYVGDVVIDQEDNSKKFLTENILQDVLEEENISNIITKLDEEEYCILANGKPICSGPSDYIQEQTRKLLFGEHELCNISIDDIVVIKRIKIKVGVFLD